jgi:hypothetical protein
VLIENACERSCDYGFLCTTGLTIEKSGKLLLAYHVGQRREGAAKDVDHDLENPEVRANFRQLVIALLWIFYARGAIDFRIFQMLGRIESGFTYLLLSR